jgi:transposase
MRVAADNPGQLPPLKRSNQTKGFAVLHKRWAVERTLAWLNRCRR